MKSLIESLQALGRALMLPIAVLPAAGLLLRLGQPDLLDIAFVAAAGNAVFANLGLLFAAGVAVGLARENHGAAGLAGIVCYLVAAAGAKMLLTVPPETFSGLPQSAHGMAGTAFRDAALARLGVPLGIASGMISGALYNRFHAIRLPDYLAFFGGRRFVPIASGFAALGLAVLLGYGYPSIQSGMDAVSHAVLESGGIGLFIYGVLNRLLIVTGLHHIINNLAWFILGEYHGATGDLNRFFAGDPSAGKFMSGFFPVMMFGLPAACLAMYQAARPERRKAVGGLLGSMALTAFLTGITEPIEFSFMFLAPVLYVIHSLLTGLSMTLMDLLGVHLGFGFSAGLFDYVINFNKSSRPLLLLPVGALYFALYYGVFRYAIARFDLKTIGRGDEAAAATAADASTRGAQFARALGGAANLKTVDACTTRLRLTVHEAARIDEAALTALGARGVIKPSANAVQVVLGPIADQVASEIRAAASLEHKDGSAAGTAQQHGVVAVDAKAIAVALGGSGNIRQVSAGANRLLLQLGDMSRIDETGLRAAGVRGIARLPGSLQLIFAPDRNLQAAASDLSSH
jgi:PTS system N-acetylglucosamine-specific IIC component